MTQQEFNKQELFQNLIKQTSEKNLDIGLSWMSLKETSGTSTWYKQKKSLKDLV